MIAPLKIEHIQKSYGRKRVLVDVSLTIAPASIVGLVGENGAGKSTLLKIIVGGLRPDNGKVTSPEKIGYCPQDPAIFDDLTVYENLQFFAAAYGLEEEWKTTADNLMMRLAFHTHKHTSARTLSGGTRQKLNLAIALLHEPRILVLDEPYAAFDWQSYLHFWELATELRDLGRSVLIVSHMAYDAPRFGEIHELRAGILERIQ